MQKTPKKQLNLTLVFRGHLQEKELSEAELLTCKVKLATVLYVCQIKSYFSLDCSCTFIILSTPKNLLYLCLRHQQIIDLLATDKSRYFAQPSPIIVYYSPKRMLTCQTSRS